MVETHTFNFLTTNPGKNISAKTTTGITIQWLLSVKIAFFRLTPSIIHIQAILFYRTHIFRDELFIEVAVRDTVDAPRAAC